MDFPKVEAREINLRPLERYSSDEE